MTKRMNETWPCGSLHSRLTTEIDPRILVMGVVGTGLTTFRDFHVHLGEALLVLVLLTVAEKEAISTLDPMASLRLQQHQALVLAFVDVPSFIPEKT